MAANLSGGGFSVYMERENYQITAVDGYLAIDPNRERYEGLYECARYRDLALTYFVIWAALWAVATPTSPLKRKITNIS